MRVLIGGLLHDRGEITDCYLRHLGVLDLNGIEVSWFFVVDGVGQWKARIPEGANGVLMKDNGPWWIREPRGQNDERQEYRRLAFMRNVLRERALMERVNALVNIDSDICAPGDLLQRMAAARAPWVSALVDNCAVRNGLRGDADPELARMKGEAVPVGRHAFNIMDFDAGGRTARVSPDLLNGGEADITGAVCWYSADLLGRVSWRWHINGEDVGFAVEATAAGYRARYLPVICDHLMTQERLALHKEACTLCH